MNNFGINKTKRKLTAFGAMTLLSITCLVAAPAAGYCDNDSYSMAPPVNSNDAPSSDSPADNPSASTVFNWQEIPVNQQVPITRAVFDQGGYQLYDTVGETIVVKFKDDNLYVMKFAVSDTDSMYFVNSGTAPTLYVPDGGYLENATVPGARWYPFTQDFQPATPVFLGCAPSWSDYCDIGWYPDMYCYGGYYCGEPFGIGVFGPSFGLFISFGGHHFDGWGGYDGFVGSFPAPYRIGYFHRDVYGFAGRSYWGGRQFHGGFGRGFAGGGRDGGGNLRAFSGGHGYGGFSGGQGHVFRGGDNNGYHGGFSGSNGGRGGFNGGGFRGGDSNGFRGGFSGSNGGRGDSNGGGFRGGNSSDGGGFHGGGESRGGNFGGGGGFHGGGESRGGGGGSHGGGGGGGRHH